MTDLTQLGERELKELAAIIRHYRRAGLWGTLAPTTPTEVERDGIRVKNIETETAPPYACMQIDGMVSEGPADDKRRYVRVRKPTGPTGVYLFNGPQPIESSRGYGVGYAGPMVRAYKNSGTVAIGDRWAPTPGEWYLSKVDGGPFAVIGDDDISTNVFRLLIVAAERRVKHVRNGATPIAAFNTTTLAMSAGVVTEHTCSNAGVLTAGSTFTAYNPGGQIAANAYGVVAMNEAGLWVWIVERC